MVLIGVMTYAQRYELQEKGLNTLILVDTGNSDLVIFNRAKEDIKFVATRDGSAFYFYLDALNIAEYALAGGKAFLPSEVLNPDTGVAFTTVDEALEWSYLNVNFKTASGGSGAEYITEYGASTANSDNTSQIQEAIDAGGAVVPKGIWNILGMLEIGLNESLTLESGAKLIKPSNAGNTDPVVWLRGTDAFLKGESFATCVIESDVRSPFGVIRFGHKDMTESHGFVNNSELSNLHVIGMQNYGQTSGADDIAIYMANPQFDNLTVYQNILSNLRVESANYGIKFDGWVNATVVDNIHGYRIGNVSSDKNAMIWVNGCLDNSINGMFFHQSDNSITLKLTNFDNTGIGGNNHEMFANTYYGIVGEQGGASAYGVWTDVVGGSSYIEIRNNNSAGNFLPVGWYDSNKMVELGGQAGFVEPYINIEDDGTDDGRMALKSDGKFIVGKSLVSVPKDFAENQFTGTILNDRSSVRNYRGTGAITITVEHDFSVTGAEWFTSCVEVVYSGTEPGLGNHINASYIIPIRGLSTWDINSPVKIGGTGTLTITQVSSTSTQTVFTVEGSATSRASIQATATGFRGVELR